MPNQVVVITGAAAGVGRATAREFANKGCDVGLIGRNQDRLDSAAEELRAFGVRTAIAIADVADDAAVEAAADSIEAALGPITIWVNNAMATVYSPVAEITAAEFRRATDVTYLGTVFGTMAALRRDAPARHRHHHQCRLGACLPLGAAAGGVLRREVGDTRLHRQPALPRSCTTATTSTSPWCTCRPSTRRNSPGP